MAPIARMAFLLALLSLAAGAACGAPGAGISLRLVDVTLADAAAAISRASGTAVEASPAAGGPRAAGAELHAGFAWENASLDRILRDVCARFQCGCSRGSAGYTLYPAAPFRK